ncbi:radical SAM protein [Clostridium thermobutyricum]|uniref:radical SAM protein n=1 Tax=Clostridium thermobutyricum TaxID=29372 RepID=UPI003100B843
MSENNLHTFCFCGGEPLLRYDLLLKMCDILSPHIHKINMVSNGYLMTKEKVLALKKHGMKHIQLELSHLCL